MIAVPLYLRVLFYPVFVVGWMYEYCELSRDERRVGEDSSNEVSEGNSQG
jgi:hypothetical protein